MQQDVRIRRACSSHRPSRGGRVATDREFVCRQLFHTAAVHHQHNYISGFAADLGAKASASELDCRGTSPPPVAAAEREPATILPANYEGSFLQPGDDHDTLGFCQKVLRYALIRSRQDLMKHRGSGPQPVVWRLLLGMEHTKRQTDHQKHSRHIFDSSIEIAHSRKSTSWTFGICIQISENKAANREPATAVGQPSDSESTGRPCIASLRAQKSVGCGRLIPG